MTDNHSTDHEPIDVLVLYPRDMNIYGDNGNILTIRKRLECYGFEPIVHYYNQGDAWPEHVDIVLGGGGQDSGQGKILNDFAKRGDKLRALAADGVPMLVVCGLYQLFGEYFETLDGYRLEGIGIFDAFTQGQDQRMIGNIVEESSEFGTLIGFENHSGQTFIRTTDSHTLPLARIVSGDGNNGWDLEEGARVRDVIGTYLHGSFLPKNPVVADFLIRTAVDRRYNEGFQNILLTMDNGQREILASLDRVAEHAREVARNRPR